VTPHYGVFGAHDALARGLLMPRPLIAFLLLSLACL